jgi:hypothetical protein
LDLDLTSEMLLASGRLSMMLLPEALTLSPYVLNSLFDMFSNIDLFKCRLISLLDKYNIHTDDTKIMIISPFLTYFLYDANLLSFQCTFIRMVVKIESQ